MRSTKNKGKKLNFQVRNPLLWGAFFFLVLLGSFVFLSVTNKQNTGRSSDRDCLLFASQYLQKIQSGEGKFITTQSGVDVQKLRPYPRMRLEPRGHEGVSLLQDRYALEASQILAPFYEACRGFIEIHQDRCRGGSSASMAFSALLKAYWAQQPTPIDLEEFQLADLLAFAESSADGLCGSRF